MAITLKIEAELVKENKMFMKFGDCTVTVRNENDNKVGQIAGTIGGGVELSDEASGRRFYISPSVLWSALQEALESEAAQ